jgi:ribonuclease E
MNQDRDPEHLGSGELPVQHEGSFQDEAGAEETSGAEEASSPEALASSRADGRAPEDPSSEPLAEGSGSDAPSVGESSDDAPGGEGVAGDEAEAPGKRRRGRRGGRRRRGRRATHGAEDAQGEGAPAEDAALDGPAVVDAPLDDEDAPLDDAREPGPAEDAALALDGDGIVVRADDEGRGKRRRRGRRGGRARADKADKAAKGAKAERSPTATSELAPATPSRRPARGGVPRELDAWVVDEDGEEGVVAAQSSADEDSSDAGREASDEQLGRDGKRRRRGGRRAKGRTRAPNARGRDDGPAEIEVLPGEELDLPSLAELPDDAELLDSGLVPSEVAAAAESERKRSRKRKGAEERDDADEAVQVPESERLATILVNASDPEEQRVAVVEGERIVDFQMTVKDHDSLVNDIYRGRVVNLEPAIGAAFIDFGEGRNGFLHTSDVLSAYGDKDFDLAKLLHIKVDPDEWSGSGGELEDDKESGSKEPRKKDKGARDKGRFRARPRLPITDLLKKGQQVVVQVTKDAIGDKGPTLTTYISIPGRYLVLMPSMSRTGVSRKIEDEKERRRLKRILQSLELPEGMGVIVRTAGVGHSKAEIKRDLDYLKNQWEALSRELVAGHGPSVLYRESDVAIRTMRDLYTPYTKEVVVDDYEVHRHLVEFTEKLMPEEVSRVKLHEGHKPLFQSQAIEPDFEKMFARRVELPSGGSVVFDQAEALVAIDVNSGRTRGDGFDFEEIALKTNLEAAPEIARQIRLRDLGGIIVVDFIDMMKNSSIKKVEGSFAEALSHDRARVKLGRISQFGLLEMTRQRLGPGLAKKVFHACPRCRGTGRLRTINSRAAAILRRLASAMTLKGFQTVEVKAHPEVIAYLKESCHDHLRGMEYRFQRDIRLIVSPEQVEDSVLRYLRTDGKEVRPGGRRKR